MEDTELKFGKETFVGKKGGKLIDYYDVVKRLGVGGYGKVYEIKNKVTGEIRAVKQLSKLDINDLDKFHREIDLLIKADHPNIIKLYEIFESEHSLYLIMEECLGGELFDRIIKRVEQKKMFSEKDAAKIILQVLSAIQYCHNIGICHRDLKPENILYLNIGTEIDNPIKLIDFGLSQYIPSKKKLKSKVGTSFYVSPEILDGKYTEKCDIWSIGVILYVILSGTPPFNGPSDEIIYSKIEKFEYSFPENRWKDISPEAKDLISNILKPEKERYNASQALEHPWFKKINNNQPTNLSFEITFFKDYMNSSILKKMVIMFIASRLKENDIKNLKELFKVFDKDCNGQITYNELKEGILKLTGEEIDKNEIKKIFDSIDTDKNGKIEYTEFISSILEKQFYLKEERLFEAFCAFDLEKKGKITKEDLLKAFKLKESTSEIDSIIQKVDKDGNGFINYRQFLEYMENN